MNRKRPIFRRIESINIAASDPTLKIKRRTVFIIMLIKHNNLKILKFLKMDRITGEMNVVSTWTLWRYPKWYISSANRLWESWVHEQKWIYQAKNYFHTSSRSVPLISLVYWKQWSRPTLVGVRMYSKRVLFPPKRVWHLENPIQR